MLTTKLKSINKFQLFHLSNAKKLVNMLNRIFNFTQMATLYGPHCFRKKDAPIVCEGESVTHQYEMDLITKTEYSRFQLSVEKPKPK